MFIGCVLRVHLKGIFGFYKLHPCQIVKADTRFVLLLLTLHLCMCIAISVLRYFIFKIT